MGPELGHLLDSLGWAILHSSWQGTLAAVAVLSFRSVTKESQASLRYGFQVACLITCFAAFAITFCLYQIQSHSHQTITMAASAPLIHITSILSENSGVSTAAAQASLSEILPLYTPLLGILWCVGFTVLAIRYCGAFVMTQRLRRLGTSSAPLAWQRRFETLVLNAGIRRTIQIFISDRVSGPLTLGFFKPVVLVPASFFAGLPAAQVEAILLHEIAHIRRHDYLINLLQTAIKTIFFFHPAVHYISRKIDTDREHACDDFAVSLTRDPQSLARGLAALRLNLRPNAFALAADNGNTPLVARLKRLGNISEARRRPEHVLTSVAALILAAGLYVSTSPLANAHQAGGGEDIFTELSAHPSGKKANYTFKQITVDGRIITAKIAENGTRWINVNGAWHDVDKNPDLVAYIPENPVPPAPPATEWTGSYVKGISENYGQYKVDLDYYIESLKYAQNNTPDTELAGASSNKDSIKQDIKKAEQNRARIEKQVQDALAQSQKQKAAAWEQAEKEHKANSQRAEEQRIRAQEQLKRAEEQHIRAQEQLDRAEEQRERAQEQLERAMEQREAAMERAETQVEVALERAEEQRERQMKRAEEQQEREMERMEEQRERAEEQRQREIERAERDMERTERERERTKDYKDFSEALMKQLKKDGLVAVNTKSVTITYPNKKMMVNGTAVSRSLEDNYCELLDKYGLKKTNKTKIKIKPEEFEYKSFSEDGTHSHEITQNFDKDASMIFHHSKTIPAAQTPSSETQVKSTIHFSHPTPKSWVSQKFATKNHDGKVHTGIDLAAAMETPIHASAPGVVIYAKSKGDWGNVIKISHQDGYETYYANVGKIGVSKGDKVSQGHEIGAVGVTGASTRPHLHFEIHHNGESLDPQELILNF